MSEQSKIIDTEPTKEAIEDLSRPDHNTDESDEDGSVPSLTNGSSAASSTAKKKKSRKAKLKKILGGSSHDAQVEESQDPSNGAGQLTPGMVGQLLQMNPSLKGDVAGLNHEQAAEALKKLDAADLLTGMVWSPSHELVKYVKLTPYILVHLREKSKGYGILQILADPTRSTIWSVCCYRGDRWLSVNR